MHQKAGIMPKCDNIRKPSTIRQTVNDMPYFQPYPMFNVFGFYKEKGGKITDFHQYHNILKLINIFITDHLMTRGSKIEIPFFGELYVEEVKVEKVRKRVIRKNNFFMPQLVFKSFQQPNLNMKLYTDFIVDHADIKHYIVNGNVFKRKRIYSDEQLFYNVFKSKRKDRQIVFYKRYKKDKKR